MIKGSFRWVLRWLLGGLHFICISPDGRSGIAATPSITARAVLGRSAELKVPYSSANCTLNAAVWSRSDSPHILYSVTRDNTVTYGQDIGTLRDRMTSSITRDEVILSIFNVTCSDEWRYVCMVYCWHRPTLRYHFDLAVTATPGNPHVQWQLLNESGHVAMACDADIGRPSTHIEWIVRGIDSNSNTELNGSSVLSPGCPSHEASAVNVTLREEQDGTEFVCRVGHNMATLAFASAQRPHISIVSIIGDVTGTISNGVRLLENAWVTLACKSEGSPLPMYKWIFSPSESTGTSLYGQERVLSLASSYATRIHVNYSTETPDGRYICQAVNSATKNLEGHRVSVTINMARMNNEPRTLQSKEQDSMSPKVRKIIISASSVLGVLVLLITALTCTWVCGKRGRGRRTGDIPIMRIDSCEESESQGAEGDSYLAPVSQPEGCCRKVYRKPQTPRVPEKRASCTLGHMNNSLYTLSSDSQLELLEELGNGFFGTVYKALMRTPQGGDTIVAAKLCTGGSGPQDMDIEFRREAETMQMVPKHQNVVDFIAFIQKDGPPMILLEFASRGDLLTLLRSMRSATDTEMHCGKSQVPGRDLVPFALQVAQGMEHISKFNLLHRDLATRNVLVFEEMLCKISDFGQARYMIQSREYERRSAGPLPIRWMAPESLANNIYTTKSDVWSFGVLMWEIATLGAVPYAGLGAKEVMTLVTAMDTEAMLEFPPHCQPQMRRLARQCWAVAPRDRPDFTSLAASLSALNDGGNSYIDMRASNLYENHTSQKLV